MASMGAPFGSRSGVGLSPLPSVPPPGEYRSVGPGLALRSSAPNGVAYAELGVANARGVITVASSASRASSLAAFSNVSKKSLT